MDAERRAAIRARRDTAFPDSLDLTAMWRTVPDLLDALDAAEARAERLATALQMVRDLDADILEEGHDTGDLPRRWWQERIKHMDAALANDGAKGSGAS